MSGKFNRAARRSEARKGKNRKTGMVALSIMATTSLMSSYVSLLRTEPSFAAGAVDTSGCTSVLPLTLDVSGTASEDVARLNSLQTDLNNAISSGTEECVTVTFTSGAGEGEDVLNFTSENSTYNYSTKFTYTGNDFVDLDLYAIPDGNNPKIIFIGNDVTFDFSFEDTDYGPAVFSNSPIRTNLALEIHDITFQNSTTVSPNSNSGGGVIRAGDDLAIFGSEFYGNAMYRNGLAAGAVGGAVYAFSNVSISDTTFANNRADGDGGALFVAYYATISGSTFVNNSAFGQSDGGAIYAYSEVLITNSTFEGNVADQGGAVYVYSATYDGQGSSEISASTFTTNRGNSKGGAVYVQGSSGIAFNTAGGTRSAFTISDSSFENNYASFDGGAVYLTGYSFVSNSTFINNDAQDNGGAIYFDETYNEVIGSTFVGNGALDDGGAIYFDENYNEVSNSTFESNLAAGDGGAIYADEDYNRIENSTFVDNDAQGDGGAIYFDESYNEVIGSTFVGNGAQDNGGAIYFNSNYNEVTSSTFKDNYAYLDGGAIYLESGDGIISNSTFVSNSSRDAGGAIWAAYENDILFNTFLDNVSDSDFDDLNPKQDLGEALSIGEGSVIGNIFAGDSQYPQIQFRDLNRFYSMEYNLSTGDDFLDNEPTNRGNVTLSDFGFDAELRDNQTTNFSQTMAITGSSSAAFGFVPLATAADWLSDNNPSTDDPPRDQRGVIRSASFVNAGAFEGFVSSSTPSVLSPASFYVLNVSKAASKAGVSVNVTGALLSKVSEVYVGGVKVKITKSSDGELSFKLPKGISGSVTIRFVGANHDHTHIMNLDGSIRNEAVVPGFGSNSTRLTKAMKNEIKAFVQANSELTQVTCKGYTSAPATAQDLRLARERGQATCDYITKLNPALDVKVLAGAHTNTPGQKVRRVRIEMN